MFKLAYVETVNIPAQIRVPIATKNEFSLSIPSQTHKVLGECYSSRSCWTGNFVKIPRSSVAFSVTLLN